MLTLLGSLGSGGGNSSTEAGALAPAVGNGRKVPTSICISPPPQAIACGSAHSFFLSPGLGEETVIFGWGGNRNNALGMPRKVVSHSENGAKRQQRTLNKWDLVVHSPTTEVFNGQITQSEDVHTRKRHVVPHYFEVACGSNHSIVLEKLAGVGNDDSSMQPPQQQRRQQQHQQELVASRVWSCGFGANGQLGRPAHTEDDDRDLPAEVVLPSFPGSRVVVQRISCGADHTLAIANFVGLSAVSSSTCGRVFAWGLGSYGALGTGNWTDELVPKEVWFPEDKIYDGDDRPGMCDRNVCIVQVAAGTKHSLALGADGAIFAWGHGGNGRLGLGSKPMGGGSVAESYVTENTPQRICGIGRMKYVAAGESHSAALDQLGALFTWGNGSHGRCGHGTATDSDTPMRVEWSMAVSVSQVALGIMHSLAVTVKGQLFAWGKGPATGLDAPDNAATFSPSPVELPENLTAHQVAAGPLHTIVLMTDGSIACFGSGSEGRLPAGTAEGDDLVYTKDQTFPLRLNDCKGVVLGGHGLRDAMGNLSSPSLGDQEQTDTNPAWWPAQIFCGGSSSVMLTSTSKQKAGINVDENLWVWGSSRVTAGADTKQEPGRDLWNPSVLKRGFRSSVHKVAVGLDHCIAITGTVMCTWGDGSKGQLGTGNLSYCSHPQPLTRPADIIHIAAGDEHSACIAQGGEAYSWGCAEGGRLGLGRCLSEGFQLTPKQIQVVGSQLEGEEVLLLRDVACGSEHMAFVTENDDLLTCGMGWFGRLGKGDTNNAYSPELVKLHGVFVRDVFCGMYHTYVVDRSGMLLVTGRDSAICKTTAGHQLDFVPFEPFVEPRRSILSLATRDEHTLAITTSPETEHGSELWVWGKNTYGQLGLPPDQAPRVDWPWQLPIKGIEYNGTKVRYNLAQVATGPKHSMCLVKPRMPNAKKKSASNPRDPVIYAWGSLSCGRLGLTHQQASLKLGFQSQENTQESHHLQNHCGEYIVPPVQLNSVWKPAEERTQQPREVQRQDVARRVEGPCRSWADAQLKLWQENEDAKRQRLTERRHDVESTYRGILDEIERLWDKPAPGDYSIVEYQVRQQETRVEREYLRTLKAVGLSGASHATVLQRRSLTDLEIRSKLHNISEIIWILQQQPLYLGRLAVHFAGRRFDDKEVDLFVTVVSQIFADLKVSRIRYLQNALFRILIDGEVSRNVPLPELFDERSRVAPLFAHMCTSPFLFEGLAMPILDPDDKNSLVNMLIRYTITKDGETPRYFHTDLKGMPTDCAGIISLHANHYEEIVSHEMSSQLGKSVVMSHEARLKLRGMLQEEWGSFAHFVHRHASEGHSHSSLDGEVSAFIAYYLKEVLHRDSKQKPGTQSVRAILAAIFNAVVSHYQGFDLAFDAGLDKMSEPEQELLDACIPSASIFLSGILGAILNALDTGPFALIRLKIIRKATQMEDSIVKRWNQLHRGHKRGRGDADHREAEINPMLSSRVLSNIKSLAQFFQVAGHHGSNLETDAAIRESAERIHVFTRRVMCSVLCGKRGGVEDGGDSSYQDMTETQLTADFYTSHFSLTRGLVSLSTVEILEFTNMLWKYMEPSGTNPDEQSLHLNPPEEDRLYRLVHRILPRRTVRGREQISPWSQDGHLWLATQHMESHNFIINPRFMEFARTGLEEPTFCEKSLVPIPRSLALPSQRNRRGVRAVRNMQQRDDKKGLLVTMSNGEQVYSYEVLEELLSSLSGHYRTHQSLKIQLSGARFDDLLTELEFLAKKLAASIEEGRAEETDQNLLQRLESGRHVIARLREKDFHSIDFFAYLDENIKRREHYTLYLQRVKEATQEIFRARIEYRSTIKERHALLSQVARLTSTCDLPSVIIDMAEQKTIPLTMRRARKIKLKTRKDRPSPAQAFYDSLKSKDGKVPDEMLETVDVPAQSYRLKRLLDLGVVLGLHDKIDESVKVKLVVNFQYKDEGYLVSMYLKTTLLKQFCITREDIVQMQTARKNSEMAYGDGFVVMNGFRLRRLLAWLSADGGL